MNPVQIHLVLTHVPVLGTVFGMFLFGLAMLKKSEELRRTGALVFVLSALLALPTYFSGDSADSFLASMHADITEQHEEIAVLALGAALVLGLLSLAGLLWFRKGRSFPAWFTGVSLAIALLTFAAMTWTASLGGKIRHPEIGGMAPSEKAASNYP
jgi:NO-binding membrane sensor protein with MHYT domain